MSDSIADMTGKERESPAWVSSTIHSGDEISGCVEQITQDTVEGWIAGSDELTPSEVSIYLDDLRVITVQANERTSRASFGCSFSFTAQVKGIWDYCTTDTQISVRCEGKVLPIIHAGMFLSPEEAGSQTVTDLKQKFAEGFLFSDKGVLQLSKALDEDWKERVFGLYSRVSEILLTRYGYQQFIIYGTLLGQVRAGDFIAHDRDFDTAFVSQCTDGPSAAAEMREIAMTLIAEGLDVEPRLTTLHIRDGSGSRVRIDLFHLYFDSDGNLRMPFGQATKRLFPKSAWSGIREVEIGGHPVQVPAAAEDLLAAIYGDDWQIPNKGFYWPRRRAQWAKDGHLSPDVRAELYWENFYAGRIIDSPSDFQEFVSRGVTGSFVVLDIGCGNGQDSLGFARQGRRVLGVDRSSFGIAAAEAGARRAGLGDEVSFKLADVLVPGALQEITEEARALELGSPVLFYCRFFLHGLTEEVQSEFLTALSLCSRDGDFFAFEFRTKRDAKKYKVHKIPFRRFQAAEDFEETLQAAFGVTILARDEGQGLSRYFKEDPFLYRVIAVKGSRSESVASQWSSNSRLTNLIRKARPTTLSWMKRVSPRLYTFLRKRWIELRDLRGK